LRDRLNVSQWPAPINTSRLTGGAIPTAWTPHRAADSAQPARIRCQCRSRSQTRSIARRHSCEQKCCDGERRWRTNPT
jgi:hypothetical protein